MLELLDMSETQILHLVLGVFFLLNVRLIVLMLQSRAAYRSSTSITPPDARAYTVWAAITGKFHLESPDLYPCPGAHIAPVFGAHILRSTYY